MIRCAENGGRSAGSATKRKDREGKGNHYNVIRLWEDGTIDFQTFYAQDVGTFIAGTPTPHVCQDVRRASEKRFFRAREQAGFEIGELRSRIRIDKFGEAKYTFGFSQLRVLDGRSINSFRITRRSDHGYFGDFRIVEHDPIISGCTIATDIDFVPDSKRPRLKWSTANCLIDFRQELTSATRPLSFVVEFPLIAAFALNIEEQALRGEAYVRAMEGVSIDIAHPVRSLRFEVDAEGFRFSPSSIDVVVLDDKHERVGRVEAELREDLIIDEHGLRVHVRYPRISHSYQLRWKLPHAADPTSAELVGNAAPLRRYLLDHSKGGAASHFATSCRPLLEQIAQDFTQRFTGWDPYGKTDASLMVFNDDTGVLEIVCSLADPHDKSWEWKELRSGYGLAGQALKMNSPALFLRARKKPDDSSIYIEPDHKLGAGCLSFKHEVLFSAPVHLVGNTRHHTFGILNVGTNSRSTRMYQLIENVSERDAFGEWLLGVIENVVMFVLDYAKYPR